MCTDGLSVPASITNSKTIYVLFDTDYSVWFHFLSFTTEPRAKQLVAVKSKEISEILDHYNFSFMKKLLKFYYFGWHSKFEQMTFLVLCWSGVDMYITSMGE